MYQNFATFAILSTVSAAAWDYKQQGKDWRTGATPGTAGSEYEFCASGQQSPIDLKTSMTQIKADGDMTFNDYKTWGTCKRVWAHETIKYSPNYDTATSKDQATTSNFKSKYMATLGNSQEFSAG